MQAMARFLSLHMTALLAAALAAAAPVHAENRALVIGIGSYADPKLAPAATDAVAGNIAAVEKLLKETLRIKPEEIRVLRDKEATREAILEGITDWLRPDRKDVEQRAKDEEAIKSGKLSKKQIRALRRKWARAARGPKRSYLYFAGLGRFQRDLNGDETDGFDEAILPYGVEVSGDGDAMWVGGAITDDELAEAVSSLDGRDVTIVLDVGFPETGDNETQAAASGPRPAPHGSAGALVETAFTRGTLAVWSAVLPGQTTFYDSSGTAPVGVFTKLYTDGLGAAMADRNGNGVVSNSELLVYVTEGSASFCAEHKARCKAGLTPQLDPAIAHGLPAAPVKSSYRRKLSMGLLTDFLVRGNADGIVLEQDPPSPLPVGTTDVRFRVKSPHAGTLVLLSLTDSGQLIQLFPNRFGKTGADDSAARIAAHAAITVPDGGNGLRLTATDPAKGHIVALFTRDRVDFGAMVTARSIGDIPRSEALKDYLPALAGALFEPLDAAAGAVDSRMATWSVATLPYEFVP